MSVFEDPTVVAAALNAAAVLTVALLTVDRRSVDTIKKKPSGVDETISRSTVGDALFKKIFFLVDCQNLDVLKKAKNTSPLPIRKEVVPKSGRKLFCRYHSTIDSIASSA